MQVLQRFGEVLLEAESTLSYKDIMVLHAVELTEKGKTAFPTWDDLNYVDLILYEDGTSFFAVDLEGNEHKLKFDSSFLH